MRRGLSPWAGQYETPATLTGAETLPDYVVRAWRRSRRHPVPWQRDYLHLRHLRDDLAAAVATIPPPIADVLDVYAGTAPYRDLLPADASYVTLDINRRYGLPDHETREFLPLPDGSFDVVLCLQALHYAEDPEAAVSELRRVLRPGGTAIVTTSVVWEYDRSLLERRFTGPSLAHLFRGWDDVRVVENGGRGTTWATVSGATLDLFEQALVRRGLPWRLLRLALAPCYGVITGLGLAIDHGERRCARSSFVLPPNVLVSARRPR